MLNMPPAAEPGEVEALRASIVSTRERLPVSPVPWDDLTRRHRAATRRRVAAAATAVAACAVSLVVALPGARTESAPEPAGQHEQDGSTVGSLASDTEFLSALRRHFAARGGDQGFQIEAADVEIVAATDLPGARVTLIGVAGTATRTWWIGAPGAPAPELRLGSGCPGPGPCWVLYGEGDSNLVRRGAFDDPPQSLDRRSNGIVVAAEPGSDVTVRAAPDITATGVVTRPTTSAQEHRPGIFVAELPTSAGTIDIEIQARGDDTPWRGSIGSPGRDIWSAPDIRGTRGAGVPALDDVRRGLADLAEQAALPAGPGSRVLWADVRQDHAGAVIALHAPSGGWAVVVMQRNSLGTSQFWLGPAAVSVRPADQVEAPLAWQWIDPATGAPSDGVGVLGPEAATRAVVVGTSGRRFDGDLDAGAGTITASDATAVEFYDAAGRQLTRTDVLPAWREGQTLESRAASG